jgi:hypothetical protein
MGGSLPQAMYSYVIRPNNTSSNCVTLPLPAWYHETLDPKMFDAHKIQTNFQN